MRAPEEIIVRPLLTEKSAGLKETGGWSEKALEKLPDISGSVAPQVAFEVAPDANKVEIRWAVERLWNVNVQKVRTNVLPGKSKRVGRYLGKRSNWKKALVTLAPGQDIEFFEGV